MIFKSLKYLVTVILALLCINYANATTYTVNTLDDISTGSGTSGSLRYVMGQISSNGDSIEFDDSLSGSIVLDNGLGVLPDITFSDIVIVGNLDINFAPVVAIDGSNLTSNSWGFRVNGTGFFISGLAIGGFQNGAGGPNNVGIYLTSSASDITVSNCYIGTIDGFTAVQNGVGVFVNEASSVSIQDGSVISGNNTGVYIFGGISCGISGCYIGTNSNGSAAIANIEKGIYASGSDLVIIDDNLISGNIGYGVQIQNSSNCIVRNNYIGLDSTGQLAMGNGRNGVEIESNGDSCDSNTIINNVISANNTGGIAIFGNAPGVTNIAIERNFIGTDYLGRADLGNQSYGIFITDIVTGTSIVDNLIAYNVGYAISMFSASCVLNDILNNSIYSNTSTPAIIVTGGANNNQQPLTLNSATFNAKGSSISVSGVAPAVGSGDNVPLLLQFFATPLSISNLNPQGKTYIGGFTISAGESFNRTLVQNTSIGADSFITAIATAKNNDGNPGDSSQFSGPIELQLINVDAFTQNLISKYYVRV